MKRNWEDLVLTALGGRDHRLTVVGAQRVNDHCHRLVDGGGRLEAGGVHPTMWIRLWFDDNGRAHQRAYTVVDPDPATGRFSLEFAVHDGCAVWLEYAHDEERDLPLRARAHHKVTGVPREDDGQLLVDTVSAEVPAADGAFYWVAAGATCGRAVARHLRKTLGIPKHRVYSLAYWSAR